MSNYENFFINGINNVDNINMDFINKNYNEKKYTWDEKDNLHILKPAQLLTLLNNKKTKYKQLTDFMNKFSKKEYDTIPRNNTKIIYKYLENYSLNLDKLNEQILKKTSAAQAGRGRGRKKTPAKASDAAKPGAQPKAAEKAAKTSTRTPVVPTKPVPTPAYIQELAKKFEAAKQKAKEDSFAAAVAMHNKEVAKQTAEAATATEAANEAETEAADSAKIAAAAGKAAFTAAATEAFTAAAAATPEELKKEVEKAEEKVAAAEQKYIAAQVLTVEAADIYINALRKRVNQPDTYNSALQQYEDAFKYEFEAKYAFLIADALKDAFVAAIAQQPAAAQQPATKAKAAAAGPSGPAPGPAQKKPTTAHQRPAASPAPAKPVAATKAEQKAKAAAATATATAKEAEAANEAATEAAKEAEAAQAAATTKQAAEAAQAAKAAEAAKADAAKQEQLAANAAKAEANKLLQELNTITLPVPDDATPKLLINKNEVSTTPIKEQKFDVPIDLQSFIKNNNDIMNFKQICKFMHNLNKNKQIKGHNLQPISEENLKNYYKNLYSMLTDVYDKYNKVKDIKNSAELYAIIPGENINNANINVQLLKNQVEKLNSANESLKLKNKKKVTPESTDDFEKNKIIVQLKYKISNVNSQLKLETEHIERLENEMRNIIKTFTYKQYDNAQINIKRLEKKIEFQVNIYNNGRIPPDETIKKIDSLHAEINEHKKINKPTNKSITDYKFNETEHNSIKRIKEHMHSSRYKITELNTELTELQTELQTKLPKKLNTNESPVKINSEQINSEQINNELIQKRTELATAELEQKQIINNEGIHIKIKLLAQINEYINKVRLQLINITLIYNSLKFNLIFIINKNNEILNNNNNYFNRNENEIPNVNIENYKLICYLIYILNNIIGNADQIRGTYDKLYKLYINHYNQYKEILKSFDFNTIINRSKKYFIDFSFINSKNMDQDIINENILIHNIIINYVNEKHNIKLFILPIFNVNEYDVNEAQPSTASTSAAQPPSTPLNPQAAEAAAASTTGNASTPTTPIVSPRATAAAAAATGNASTTAASAASAASASAASASAPSTGKAPSPTTPRVAPRARATAAAAAAKPASVAQKAPKQTPVIGAKTTTEQKTTTATTAVAPHVPSRTGSSGIPIIHSQPSTRTVSSNRPVNQPSTRITRINTRNNNNNYKKKADDDLNFKHVLGFGLGSVIIVSIIGVTVSIL
jgi:hypothetical protein